MKQPQTIFIYADWLGLDGPILVGKAHVDYVRGKKVLSLRLAYGCS